MGPTNLLELLERAATRSKGTGITTYSPGNVKEPANRLSYNDLLQLALANAPVLHHIPDITEDTIFLLHFDNHLDGFEWLWSVIAAGHLPAISTPLTNDLGQRRRHLLHLEILLHHPIIITRDHLIPDFVDLGEKLHIRTIESLQSRNGFHRMEKPRSKGEHELAALMLTSGSTGNAKAVELRHGQLLQAVQGKTLRQGTKHQDTFLSWIGLDHVANLTEVHLHAMSLAADQIHVSAIDMLADPMAFLRLINKHRVAYTFAPNFFLASLKKILERGASSETNLDLSCLRALNSGGEANVTETCDAVTKSLAKYNALKSFIRPGFGMTETCAGSIYSFDCPAYDVERGLEFTSLGSSVPGLSMRVVKDDGSVAYANEVGDLQVSGPVVFQGYYNNPNATEEAFTKDNWFITGDRAYIDVAGNLNLSGRAKESIIINGVKYFPHEIEAAIEDANIVGVVASHIVTFAYRPKDSQTEALCVLYLPSYKSNDVKSRVEARSAISEVAVRQCSARPYRILPLGKEVFSKTSLGKLSRAKMRAAFENGVATSTSHNRDREYASRDFAEFLEAPESSIGIETSLFDLGVSSVELLRINSAVNKVLRPPKPVAIASIMLNPTIRKLAASLEPSAAGMYKPAVTLQGRGSGTPLWLVHPGVGEILIFFGLAKHIVDRPRYYDEIKRLQPEGPYAIAGYSYGATIAFEMVKIMKMQGDEIKFFGVIDQPPNIQARMHYSNWTNVVITMAKFVEIIEESQTSALNEQLRDLSRDEVLSHLLSLTTQEHLNTMAMDKSKLARWTDFALNNHVIARKYEPSGHAPVMDVFYAGQPDFFYAKTGEEMMRKHLHKWQQHTDTDVAFHQVQGTHNDMLRGGNVSSFYRTLKAAMERRGV
ncbi:MAG: hypothetical protein ALECFALPRED_005036 [Alectoria fallacina]|uniref:Carrier domain-containing protein n=1 Tax=Alectoria fallacina TaxID=1903189 RepID=A0A8H3G1R2_9LECA|nr:MAG: hypothetical protein ALECFALPRED_005036 [Alectoria fallacina]